MLSELTHIKDVKQIANVMKKVITVSNDWTPHVPHLKILSYKSFKSHKMIHCAACFSEATLGFRNE